MIYLTSITIFAYLLLVVTALGRRVADLLPNPFNESSSFFISPLLGLATVILITTVYGWLSPFRTGISIVISLVILLFGFVFEKRRSELIRDWLIVFAFTIMATLPILAPAIRFDSFNPFNDTFTYLVHSQWLQEHAFSETARASGFFPSETQVRLYQLNGLRMGASFFLGFVQSLFRLEWSYYAYLPVVSLVFALGSLAIGGIIRNVVPVSRTVCLVLCTLPAFTMNGFVYGAQGGFFPQTFGLAFSAGLACLIPGLATFTLNYRETWAKQFFHLLPLALCCAVFLITYNDLFPLVCVGIGLFFLLICMMYWKEKYRIIGSILILSIQVSALVNIEGARILKNYFHTLLNTVIGTVHFGWPVPWLPIQFAALSFGMKFPFRYQHNVETIISTWAFLVLLIVIAFILVKILRTKPRNLTVLFLLCINLVFWFAFVKFRYGTPGLEGEIGNTFLQFKVAKWMTPFNMGLSGIAIAWFFMNAEKCRRVCRYAFLAFMATGMFVQFAVVAPVFTKHFQDEAMRMYSPFSVFLELRSQVANIPKDQVIYLGIPHEHHKVTQMIAYVLSDRKLAGKYEDGYIAAYLPENERDMPLELADWMITLKPTRSLAENPLERVGPFLIHRTGSSCYIRESITNAYNMERDTHKEWNWVKDHIEYKFRHIGKSKKTKIIFEYLVSGHPRTLFLELNTSAGKRVASFEIPMKDGWGHYESPLINTNSEDVIVRLRADGEPVRLSNSDPREAKFLIQNFSLESVL